METKVVKVINVVGEFAIVSVDGKKIKARVEGKIPSYAFLGEIVNEKGRVVIRVKDEVFPLKEVGNMLLELDLPKTQKNYMITKLLMSLSLPILKEYYRTLEKYQLPYLISSLIIRQKSKQQSMYLSMAEVVFKEFLDGKISEREFSIFVNSLVGFDGSGEFKIFWLEEGERWFSWIEFNEDGFKKIVLTSQIGGIEVLIIFERLVKKYSLSISFFYDEDFNVSESSKEELRKNLESLGFNPIYIDIRRGIQ